ncbi:MAG: hypothetical protein WC390_06510 [Sulfurimonas sp.]|jgi:hypothetical protein
MSQAILAKLTDSPYAEYLRQLTNDELASEIIHYHWAVQELDSPLSDVLEETIERLKHGK